MLIAVNGWSRSGKGEIANILVRKYGFTQWSFADGLRYVLGGILEAVRPGMWAFIDEYGWDAAKEPFPEVVEAMIQLGARVRDIDRDFWARALPEEAKNGANYVVPDLRFPNEFEAILEADGQVWKVLRKGVTPRGMDCHLDSVSDSGWDFVICNNGNLEDLEGMVDLIMREQENGT